MRNRQTGSVRMRRSGAERGAVGSWREGALAIGVALALLQPWWSGVWSSGLPSPTEEVAPAPEGSPEDGRAADAGEILQDVRRALSARDPQAAVRLASAAARLEPLRLESYQALGEACLAAGDSLCAERAYRALARAARWRGEGG